VTTYTPDKSVSVGLTREEVQLLLTSATNYLHRSTDGNNSIPPTVTDFYIGRQALWWGIIKQFPRPKDYADGGG
jgi:hypothetical protein